MKRAARWSEAEFERRIGEIVGDHADFPELAELIDITLRHRFEANHDPKDWDLFRRTLRLGRDAGMDDPVEFAVRKVESEHAIKAPVETFRKALKAAKTASAKRADKIERDVEKASKSATKAARTFPQRDLKYVHELGWAEQKGFLADRALVEQEIKRTLGNYKPPHWDHVTLPLRVLTWSIVTHEGGGYAFSLHLGTDTSERARKSGRGVAAFVQERIRDELIAEFGPNHVPDFWLGVELKGAAVHVHGGVFPVATSDAYQRLWNAITAAGGEWKAKKGGIHQLDLKDLYGPYNWASYVLKQMNLTRSEIGSRTVASSRGMAARTKERWKTLRGELPAA